MKYGGPVRSREVPLTWSEIVAQPRAVARFAGVTERTIRRWVADGTLTNYGSDMRILVSVVEVGNAKPRRALARSGLFDTVSVTV